MQLLVKLTLLDYKTKFCNNEFQSIYPSYFQTKNINQFHYFTHLCGWLLRQCDSSFVEWSEFDAPDTICKMILQEANNISSKKLNLNLIKLKNGFGDEVVAILNTLCDCALLIKNIKYGTPKYPKKNMGTSNEDNFEEEFIEDEIEDLPSDNEDVTNECENNLFFVDKVDSKEWEIELEKVTPRLRIKMLPNQSEWRTHVYKAQNHSKNLKRVVNDTTQKLIKRQRRLDKNLKRIKDKELYFNQSFQQIKEQYISKNNKKDEMNDRYELINGNINQLTAELQKITENIQHTKNQTNKQNDSMTDVSPLQRMRSIMKKLQNEIGDMNLRIAVQQHQALQAKIIDSKENRKYDINEI